MRRTLCAQRAKKVASDICSLGQVLSGLVGFAVRLAILYTGSDITLNSCCAFKTLSVDLMALDTGLSIRAVTRNTCSADYV